jgi:agmatinase
MPDIVSIRTVLHGVKVPALRPGVPTFLGVPLAKTAADLEAADVAIIGVPQGAAASPGRDPSEWADFGRGPENARKQSMRYTGYLPELDIDVFDSLKVVDCGDAEIPEGDHAAAIANTAAMVERAVRAGCAVIAIGGAVPTANYAVARGAALATDGKVGTVGLDAHGDAFDSLGGPFGNTAPGPGTWQRRLWEHCQNVDPAHQVEFGMRGPRNGRQVFNTYREKGVSVYTARKMSEMGVDAACAEAIPRATEGVARTWISLDMDVLDIGALSDWGDEPLGLSGHDVVKVVHEAARAGADVLALQFVAPDSPAAGRLAVYIAIYMMVGLIEGGHFPKGR